MDDVMLDPTCNVSSLAHLDVRGGGRIIVGHNTSIGDFAYLMPCGGEIRIGSYCSIQLFCILYGHGGLTIGNYVRIAAQSLIIPSNHNVDALDEPIFLQGESSKGIVIGDDVWIGAGCKILDGVTIGQGSVIGAGSVVTRSIPPYSVAVGVPARVIRKRGEAKKLEGQDEQLLT